MVLGLLWGPEWTPGRPCCWCVESEEQTSQNLPQPDSQMRVSPPGGETGRLFPTPSLWPRGWGSAPPGPLSQGQAVGDRHGGRSATCDSDQHAVGPARPAGRHRRTARLREGGEASPSCCGHPPAGPGEEAPRTPGRGARKRPQRSLPPLPQFPLYWFSVPAVLKGWMDRVLCQGFAFDLPGFYDDGLLKVRPGEGRRPSGLEGASQQVTPSLHVFTKH